MKKTSESDRLRAVYADQSDGELLRLHDERDGLTDPAKEALAAEMQQRGLTGLAEEETREAPSAEEDRLAMPAEASSSEEVPLWTFSDTYQLSDMVRLLEESTIAFRLERESESNLAGLRGQQTPGVIVLVERAREREARSLLRQVLFASGQDQAEPPELVFIPPTGLTLLLTCAREDALTVVHALANAGISFYWRDGREDEDVPGENIVGIEVHAAQRERADQLVQEWMSTAARKEEDEVAAADV